MKYKHIEEFKQKMILKAKKKGLYENFGQDEIRKLKDKYQYNPYGSPKEREDAKHIDALEMWCMNYTG